MFIDEEARKIALALVDCNQLLTPQTTDQSNGLHNKPHS
jgi:hypothetical protein